MPADNRCIHEMLPGQCAICLNHDTPQAVEIASTFTARYAGRCAVNRDHAIDIGDLAGFTADDEIVCYRCVIDAHDRAHR